jgi:predicted DNA-binding antitoxin AbrB/MazE fold protein
MTIQVDAIYQDGVLMPKQRIALPNGISVRVAIEAPDEMTDPLAKVIGICDGPSDSAEAHEYIYGRRQA